MKATGNRLIIGCMAALTLCLLFTACQDDEVVGDGNTDRKEISFGIVTKPADGDGTTARSAGKAKATQWFVLRDKANNESLRVRATVTDGITPSSDGHSALAASTRATLINSEANMTDFRVLAYWKKGNESTPSSFYMNEKVEMDGTCSNTYYWPGNGHSLRFVAIAPYAANGLGLPTTPESNTLIYNVPIAASEQKDIMIATPTYGTDDYFPGNHTEAIALSFSHICTAVKFEFADTNVAADVTSISLTGIVTGEKYILGEGWDETTATTGVVNITIGEPFMMIPQTLTDNATVNVVYNDKEKKGKLKTEKIQSWDEGTTVTYKVSINSDPEGSVDLGIVLNNKRILWADKNVGATNEWDYGGYFAWGSTVAMSGPQDANEDNEYTLDVSKYGTNLPLSADAARSIMTAPWRMPTKEELQKLIDNCEVTWESEGKKAGLRFTSKIKAGMSIFLPAGGWYYNGTLISDATWGRYWSATCHPEANYPYDGAYLLSFFNESAGIDNSDGIRTFHGFLIRAVCEADLKEE